VAKGLRNDAIARRLFISPGTVKCICPTSSPSSASRPVPNSPHKQPHGPENRRLSSSYQPTTLLPDRGRPRSRLGVSADHGFRAIGGVPASASQQASKLHCPMHLQTELPSGSVLVEQTQVTAPSLASALPARLKLT
jgi:hypothetical protein